MDAVEQAEEYARENESPKRFSHTKNVARDCEYLAQLFELPPEDKSKLIFAAWLHDCTKELTPDEQKEICERNADPLPEAEYSSPTVHALTGAYRARELFPEYADDLVFGAIRCHTTGRAGMTLPEMLLCFADYTEPSRKYEGCRRLRAEFYGSVTRGNRYRTLYRCLAQSFEMTITSLTESGDPIDRSTLEAKEFLQNLLS